jgi:hypothetical protein
VLNRWLPVFRSRARIVRHAQLAHEEVRINREATSPYPVSSRTVLAKGQQGWWRIGLSS